jgi:hypothetical protein
MKQNANILIYSYKYVIISLNITWEEFLTMCSGNCTCRKFKVYKVDADGPYSGYSLVAAENSEQATQYIKDFKNYDSNNECDSWGYCDIIIEEDQIEGLFSEKPGIINYGISYCG